MSNTKEEVISDLLSLQPDMARIRSWDLNHGIHKNIEKIVNDIFELKSDEYLDLNKLLENYGSLEESKIIFVTGYLEFFIGRNILLLEFKTKNDELIPTEIIREQNVLDSKNAVLNFNGKEYSGADILLCFKRNVSEKKQMKLK